MVGRDTGHLPPRPDLDSNQKIGFSNFSINYKRKQTKKRNNQNTSQRTQVAHALQSHTSSFGAGAGRTLAFSLAARRLALGESGGARRQ